MASIGPQLPPHLQKRKRTPEDEEAESGSPPPKASRRENDDEIPLDDDDLDDAFGPSAPGPTRNGDTEETASRPKPVVGPSLPPSVANNSTPAPGAEKRSIGPSLPPTKQPSDSDEIPLDSDSDQDTPGPAPPPRPPKRVLGPAPPPADLSERPTNDPDDSDSSEDDDDDWGPALPGESSTRSRAAAAAAAAAATSSLSEPEPGSTAPKRDDWMLAPPTSSGPRAPDPTKLRPRKFATGPRAATAADGRPPAGVSAIWTETPEEKARRLANAVLGREDPNAAPPAAASRGPEVVGGGGSSSSRRADAARVKSYVEQTRGKSLVEQHQEARAAGKAAAASSAARLKGDGAKWGVKAGGSGDGDDEEDDPSKRAFDWEKDMKVLGRITNAQRRELLNRAANFGDRFQSGKFL
ncbi:uncharacterized protein P884DRAFT_297192 [Thermothelomyces heterothallicus CBS 202.75]|uniref:uncharacterized protein n=1 Tax=Thermothelomyces heterothallicus CBS 202.75 TaxID=1149848 RepID=UPI003742DF0D